MNTKMAYPWYESLPFILFASLFWILVIPIPITIFCVVRRLERKQLSRLLISKVLSIDYYLGELAILKGRENQERFHINLEVNEQSFQYLESRQEELRREYDLLVFQRVLDEKLTKSDNENSGYLANLNVVDLAKEADVEKVFMEKEKNERAPVHPLKTEIKKDRIIISEDEFFEEEEDY